MSYDPNTPSNPSYPPPGQGAQPPAYGQQQQPPAYGQQGYGNAPAYSGGGSGYPGPTGQKNTFALVAMILGIASLVLIWLPIISIIGIIAAIVGLLLGIIALRRAPVLGSRGQALAGVICSSITVVIFIISIAVVGSIIASNN